MNIVETIKSILHSHSWDTENAKCTECGAWNPRLIEIENQRERE